MKKHMERFEIGMKQSLDNKLVVVTGGAGFIGSGVIRMLNDRGIDNILVVDDLASDGKWKNLVQKRFLDVIPSKDIFEWLDGKESEVDAFIHLGACSDTLEMNASYLLENNYRYSIKLAEWALKYEKRFIYASSAATYGMGDEGFEDNEAKLETLKPLNMYGYSKHLFDLWLKRENLLDQVVGLKYFNVFGPNENHKGRMASAIMQLLPRVQEDKEIKLFKSLDHTRCKDGEQKRDFIYVKDAARITCDFLDNEAGGIFNVGTGIASTWNELAEGLFLALGMKPKITYIDMPYLLSTQYQDYTKADVGKIKKLGMTAKMTSLKEAIDDYVKNYLLLERSW